MTARLLHGDCLEQLRALPADSVQCCVTSPPYFGLRDYGTAGQIGLEPTIDEYVAKLVDVFREVRRVLRPDGLLWLNLGDSYATRWSSARSEGRGGLAENDRDRRGPPPDGYKNKELMGIPWRVAFALQADGWWLRDAVVWAKPNPMPESVTDRCTKAYELVFMLAKSERYYFDQDAISEEAVGPAGGNIVPTKGAGDPMMRTRNGLHAAQQRAREAGGFDRRNRRNVWTITTEPYPEAHFATFPTELPRICILASTRPGDTVLDPFNGSGTTGAVALSLARQYIGIELNPAYVELTERRLAGTTLGLPLEVSA